MGDKKPLTVVCIGAGYVGGPTMAVIANNCPHIKVVVCDISAPRINAWNSPAPTKPNAPSSLPIYEPGLADAVFATRGKNLFFTTDMSVLQEADIIFISVNTPTKTCGVGAGKAADLFFIESCSRLIGETVKKGHKVIVEKSTVPVRCSLLVKRILDSYSGEGGASFSIVSNPEFLAEGTAMSDLQNPDRVLIGGQDPSAIELLSSVYRNWVPQERIIATNLWSSELSKLVANAFLAQRISSINSISALCERTGAEVMEVSRVIGKDHRIGPNFLHPSVGFGGSCFQKDILNLTYICESLNLPEVAEYWMQVITMNNYQKERFYRSVVHQCFDTVSRKHIAVLGFAFKKNTGDTRESPAIYICSRLLAEGATLHIYDPKVSAESVYMELEYFMEHDSDVRSQMSPHSPKEPLINTIRGTVHVHNSAEDAAAGAAALLVLTEWDEFKTLDYQKIFDSMSKPAFLFDGRILLDSEKLKKIGFVVHTIGSQSETSDNFQI